MVSTYFPGLFFEFLLLFLQLKNITIENGTKSKILFMLRKYLNTINKKTVVVQQFFYLLDWMMISI
jgi:hypothetical protein